jgi:hypothetical protein
VLRTTRILTFSFLRVGPTLTRYALRVWAKLLAEEAGPSSGGDGKGGLRPLVYPLVQVALGAIRLLPTSRHFAYRFHCVRLLAGLAEGAEVYIPLASLVLDVLDAAEMKKRPSPQTGKPLVMQNLLKVSKGQLNTPQFQDAVAAECASIALKVYAGMAYSIAFPEATFPDTVRLRKVLKSCKSASVTKRIKPVSAFTHARHALHLLMSCICSHSSAPRTPQTLARHTARTRSAHTTHHHLCPPPAHHPCSAATAQCSALVVLALIQFLCLPTVPLRAQVLEKMEENAAFIRRERASCGFSPKDATAVLAWERALRDKGQSPLARYHKVVEAAEESRKRMGESTQVVEGEEYEKPSKKARKGRHSDDDEDDEDDDEDDDDEDGRGSARKGKKGKDTTGKGSKGARAIRAAAVEDEVDEEDTVKDFMLDDFAWDSDE